MSYVDPVTHWHAYPSSRCGGRAYGDLLGPGNTNYGPYCKACGERRLKAAERARMMESNHRVAHTEQP